MAKNDQILDFQVPKEVSRRAGFNGAHNFGVTTPLEVKIGENKLFDNNI